MERSTSKTAQCETVNGLVSLLHWLHSYVQTSGQDCFENRFINLDWETSGQAWVMILFPQKLEQIKKETLFPSNFKYLRVPPFPSMQIPMNGLKEQRMYEEVPNQ